MKKIINYRPEIDGLRAIAVLSVVIYHAKFLLPNGEFFLSGGYLGVDVFFVISGYLITKLIMRELENQGTFSFLNFYKRRAIRILPALFVVIFFTIPFAWLFLLPQEMVDYSNSILSTIFFYSNYLFWTEDSYWAISGELKPLLHSWSLAVEEQYYLIFPIVITLLFRWSKNHIFWFLILLIISSFYATVKMTPLYPDTTFYLLPFRIWELMVGGILVFFKPITKLFWWTRLLMATSFLLLIWSFLSTSSETLHPYWITIVPVLSTSVIIYLSHSEELITRVLSSKLFVSLGLVSYPLYLWHYPIFSFLTASATDVNSMEKILLILISLSLSVLTYKFIEKQIRFNNRYSIKTLTLGTVISIVILGAFSLSGLKTNGFKYRLSELYDVYAGVEPSNRVLQISSWTNESLKSEFNEAKVKVLIHGDSHSKDMFNALYLNRQLLPGFDFLRSKHSFTPKRNKACFANDTQQLDSLLNSTPYKSSNYIIISDFFSSHLHINCLKKYLSQVNLDEKPHILFSAQRFDLPAGLDDQAMQQVEMLRSNNNLIDLFYHRYPLRTVTAVDMFVLSNGNMSLDTAERLQFEAIPKSTVNINSELKKIASQYNIKYINKYDYLCSKEKMKCTIFTPSGKKIYSDRTHFSLAGAKFIGEKIINLFLYDLFNRK